MGKGPISQTFRRQVRHFQQKISHVSVRSLGHDSADAIYLLVITEFLFFNELYNFE